MGKSGCNTSVYDYCEVYNQVAIEKFYQCKYGLNIYNLIVQL